MEANTFAADKLFCGGALLGGELKEVCCGSIPKGAVSTCEII
jgi:hypothetical protein